MASRIEIYNRIDACGHLKYADFILMLESIQMTSEAVRSILIGRVKQNGTLSAEDWLLLARVVVWVDGTIITEDTIAEWLLGNCGLTRDQLVLFLENVEFENGEPPTVIITEEGNYIIKE